MGHLGTDSSATGTITDDDDADTRGYFTGSAALASGNLTDVRAIAYNNRLMVFSPGSNNLYDIDITSVTGTNFTGTVDVYADGLLVQENAVTVTGTTNESQVQATFAGGTGIASGSFDILFDTQNNRGAALTRIQGTNATSNIWIGNLFGIDQDTGKFSALNNGEYVGTDDTTEFCAFQISTEVTLVIPDVNLNIFQMSHNIENQGGGGCAPPYESNNHTGFASVIDNTGTNDELVFAFSNGAVAVFGIMNH